MGRKRKQGNESVASAQDAAMSSFEELRSTRIKKNTRNIYNSKVNALKEWLQRSQYHDCVTEGKIYLPLPVEAIKAFFGYLAFAAIEREKCRTKSDIATIAPTEPLMPSTLQGYRSAIVDFYRENNTDISSFNGLIINESFIVTIHFIGVLNESLDSVPQFIEALL